MFLSAKVIESASIVLEGKMLPFKEFLLGVRGTCLHFLVWGCSAMCSLGAGIWDGQRDTAWLHLSTHPRGGMDMRNAVLDTVFTNRAGV